MAFRTFRLQCACVACEKYDEHRVIAEETQVYGLDRLGVEVVAAQIDLADAAIISQEQPQAFVEIVLL